MGCGATRVAAAGRAAVQRGPQPSPRLRGAATATGIRRRHPGHGGRPGAQRRTTGAALAVCGCHAARRRLCSSARAPPTCPHPTSAHSVARARPGRTAGARRPAGTATFRLPARLAHRPLQLPLQLLLPGAGGAVGEALARPAPASWRSPAWASGACGSPAANRPSAGTSSRSSPTPPPPRASRRSRSPPTATAWTSWPGRCARPASAAQRLARHLRPRPARGLSGRGAAARADPGRHRRRRRPVPLAQAEHGGAARRERGRAGRPVPARLGRARSPASSSRCPSAAASRCRWPRSAGCSSRRASPSRPTGGAAGARRATCGHAGVAVRGSSASSAP